MGETLEGFDGNDILSGKSGNDVIHGGDGNDMIDGKAGNNVIYGGDAADCINGGDGIDTLIFKGDSVRANGVTVSLKDGDMEEGLMLMVIDTHHLKWLLALSLTILLKIVILTTL